MEQLASAAQRLAGWALFGFALLWPLGCAPNVNILGVYFPGWLVSTVVGVLSAYIIVLVLARSSNTRRLSDSGLFFVSQVVGIALIVWWAFFSGF